MSYLSKAKWMSFRSAIAVNSFGDGRAVVVGAAAGAGAGAGLVGAAMLGAGGALGCAGVVAAGGGAVGAGADAWVVAGRLAPPARARASSGPPGSVPAERSAVPVWSQREAAQSALALTPGSSRDASLSRRGPRRTRAATSPRCLQHELP